MKCPRCGYINREGAMNCENCRVNLAWAIENYEAGLPKPRKVLSPAATEVSKSNPLADTVRLVLFLTLGLVASTVIGYIYAVWLSQADNYFIVLPLGAGIVVGATARIMDLRYRKTIEGRLLIISLLFTLLVYASRVYFLRHFLGFASRIDLWNFTVAYFRAGANVFGMEFGMIGRVIIQSIEVVLCTMTAWGTSLPSRG